MTEDKRNVLRIAKDGEGTCLDCEWGTCLFGGGKGAVCLHTGKKNINELTRCEKWEIDGNAFLKLQSDVTQFLKDSEVEK